MRKARHGRLLPCLALALTLAFPCALGEETVAPYTIESGVLTVAEGITELGNPYLGEEEGYDFDSFPSIQEEGFLSQIVLPSTLRKVNDGSFLFIWGVDELVLPEGVEEVHTPFYYCGFRRIAFPSTLRVFDGLNSSYSDDLDQLEEIVVAADNPYFKSVDGVLFTADMKTLLYYPAAKQGAHYDVPEGVLTIGKRAFWGNLHLESVSLPVGLAKIEWAAFADCHSLLSVSFPLTLQSVDKYAFHSCLFLQRAEVPPQARVDETAFEYCRALAEANGMAQETDSERDEYGGYDVREKDIETDALLSPENARDFVSILEEPKKGAKASGKFQSGSYIRIVGEENGYYAVDYEGPDSEAGASGFVRMDEVSLIEPYQGMFPVSSARLRRKEVRCLYSAYALPPHTSFADFGASFGAETPLTPVAFCGQWLKCSYSEQDDAGWWKGSVYFSLSDLILTRPYTGDSRTFGIVINPDPRDRLNLRAKPSRSGESLGKFFTGTQVEILEEAGDWYRVRVGFDEGYMMRDFIMIIEQEEAKP